MVMVVPKNKAEWLALRHPNVSSTESAALFGLSPYMTAYELALAKQKPEPDPGFAGNERMEWGLVLQRAIARRIGAVYGVKVRALNGYSTHSYGHALMGASFDFEIVGLVDSDDGEHVPLPDDCVLRDMYEAHGAGVLEIKNVDWIVFKQQWRTDDGEVEPPAHIEIQVQHQLACIARKWAAIGVLVGGNDLNLLVRERDDDVVKAIVGQCESFWHNLSRGILPPVELPADAAVIAQVYKIASPGKVLNADTEVEALCADYRAAADAEKAASEAKATAKAKLLMKIGDAEKVIGEKFTVSAGTVTRAEYVCAASTYRNVRVTAVKAKQKSTKNQETVNV